MKMQIEMSLEEIEQCKQKLRKIKLRMLYNYYGYCGSSITLVPKSDSGDILVFTDNEELIGVAEDGNDLADILDKLRDDKYKVEYI